MSSKEETLNPDNANRLIQGMMHRLHNNRMAKSNSKAIHSKKKEPKENNLFESTDKTIKRIKNNGYDSRYGN
jgi:hypothetical protein